MNIFKFLGSKDRPGLYALLAALGLSIITVLFFLITGKFFDAKLSLVFFIPLLGLFLLNQSSPGLARLQAITKGALLFMIVFGLASLFSITYENIINPREWDFLCWFVDGKLAVSGLNFYDLNNYAAVFSEIDFPMTPSQTFRDETVNLGFLYFPQAILLYYPLGFMDFDTAHIFWAGINYLAFFGCIYLVRQLFFPKSDSGLGLMYSAAFMLLFPSTQVVFYYDQNHFILIFFLLLALKTIANNKTGIWLALGVCIKPIGLIFGLILVAKEKWKALLVSVFTGFLVTLLTVVLFGLPTVLSFFTANPHVNVPEFMYTQTTNISLLGVILRKVEFDFASGSPTRQPLYLAITLVLTIITLLAAYKLPKKHANWGLGLIIALAVVIYPGSLITYSAFMLIPFFLLLTLENNNIIKNQSKFILLACFSGLLVVRIWSLFPANVLMWALLLYCAYKFSAASKKEKEINLSTSAISGQHA